MSSMVKANERDPLKCALDFPTSQLLPIPGILLKRYFLLSYMPKSSLCSKGQFSGHFLCEVFLGPYHHGSWKWPLPAQPHLWASLQPVTAVCFRVPLSSNQNKSSLKAGNQVWWITTEDSPKTQGISFWNRELWDTSLSSCLCGCFLKEEGYFCSSIMSEDLNFLCSSIWTRGLTLIVLEGFVLFGLPEAWQSNTSQLSNPQSLQREPHIHPL